MPSEEHPRFVVPSYLAKLAKDISLSAPGHRFLLYFKGASDKWTADGPNREKRHIKSLLKKRDEKTLRKNYRLRINTWQSLSSKKLEILKEVIEFPESSNKLLEKLVSRQAELAKINNIHKLEAKLIAPLTLGLGNPHSIENGFSFLSPYGIPSIPGSTIKGALKQAAEKLALFNPNSQWTVSLVWLLFGFEGTSGFLKPLNTSVPDILKEEAEKLRQAFREWAKNNAANDRILINWLEKIAPDLPEGSKKLCKDPEIFCFALMEDNDGGKILRSSISWKGCIRFSDTCPEGTSLSVEILNPHHKNYYEGKTTPHDSEAPVPIYFLAVPENTKCTFFYKIDPKAYTFTNNNIKELVKEAFDEMLSWYGLGAKTSEGYGLFQPHSIEKPSQNIEAIIKPKKSREELRQEELKSFEQSLPAPDKLPGEAASIVEKIKKMEDLKLKKQAIKIFKTKFKNPLKKAKKNKKTWALEFLSMANDIQKGKNP